MDSRRDTSAIIKPCRERTASLASGSGCCGQMACRPPLNCWSSSSTPLLTKPGHSSVESIERFNDFESWLDPVAISRPYRS